MQTQKKLIFYDHASFCNVNRTTVSGPPPCSGIVDRQRHPANQRRDERANRSFSSNHRPQEAETIFWLRFNLLFGSPYLSALLGARGLCWELKQDSESEAEFISDGAVQFLK